VYQGYHIPARTVIIPNQWAILREQELYPDPESFQPERWLESGYPTYQEPRTIYPNLKRFAAFGYGRRVCPGLEVSEKSLFLQVSSLLYWACNIRRAKDANGEEIEFPWYDYTGVAISTPRKFRFHVEERAEGRLKMMGEAALADHANKMAMAQDQHI
jgi:Cytochrome P450